MKINELMSLVEEIAYILKVEWDSTDTGLYDEMYSIAEDLGGVEQDYDEKGKASFIFDSDMDAYQAGKAMSRLSPSVFSIKFSKQDLEGGEEKIESKKNEGTWSLPDSSEKRKQAKSLLKELESWKDKAYDVLGNDELFDGIDAAIAQGEKLINIALGKDKEFEVNKRS